MKSYNVYTYKEKNNPYARGEEVSVERIEMDKGEEYIEIFVVNEDCDGCGIYLSKAEANRLAESIKSSI